MSEDMFSGSIFLKSDHLPRMALDVPCSHSLMGSLTFLTLTWCNNWKFQEFEEVDEISTCSDATESIAEGLNLVSDSLTLVERSQNEIYRTEKM